MMSVVLQNMGYTVIDVENGIRAVARIKKNHTAIKLIILDGVMPKMNGLEAYLKISVIGPISVVYS